MDLSALDMQELKAFARREGQLYGIEVTVRSSGGQLYTLKMANPTHSHSETILLSDQTLTVVKTSIRRIIQGKAKDWGLM
jgi:hypothetical protein